MRPTVLLSLLLATTAHAQTFDGSGPVVPPLRVDPADPIFGFGAAPAESASLTLLGEAATNPLVYQLQDGETTTLDPVVGSLFGANLSGRGSLNRWVDVGVSLPVWVATDGVATGAAVGDAHLWVPVRAYQSDSLDVSVVPFFRAPTGPDARFLGDPAGGGLLASVGYDGLGPMILHGDLGFDGSPSTESADWPGSVRGRFALDVGVRLGQAVALHGEVRGRSPLGASVYSVPTEGMLSLRGRAVDQVSLTLGAGRAITQGVGAAAPRLFVGATFSFARPEEAELRFAAPEKQVREVNVIDALRLPIRGATVTAGGTEMLTDHEGFVDLPMKSLRDGEFTVSAPGYLPVTRAIDPDDPYWEVQLQRAPVAVAVSVVAPDGTVVDADVVVEGPADAGEASVGEAGVQSWELSPGTWKVRIDSEGYGSQERTVVIDPNRVDGIRVDAILTESVADDTALDVRVVDALGRPVEDAVVAIENRDLGTTGSGGDLKVTGIEKGEHAIVVRSTQFGQAVVQEVTVTPGEDAVVTVPLQWSPGSVLVRVKGPDGKPTDATVALSGPDVLPERTVGTDGEELFVLRPGRWEVEVRSATLAPQTRVIEVDDTPGLLVTLDVGLVPEEGGDASLDLVVVDPDGWPVEGLDVTLDNLPAGKTGPDGRVQLRELQRGVRFVQVQGGLVVPRLTEVDLVGNHQRADVLVWWADGVVDLAAQDADGRPIDATVTPTGPIPYPSFGMGLDGFERRVFTEGEWAFEVSAEGMAPLTRSIDIVPDTHRRQRVNVTLAPPPPQVGTLYVVVKDPTGSPPESSMLTLDGADAGDVNDGVFELDGVPVGPLEIGLFGPGYSPVMQEVVIEGERTEVVLRPEWAPGALRVRSIGPDGAVPAVVEAISQDEQRPPMELTGGSRVLALSPGVWTLTASYEGLSTATRTVQLSDKAQLTEITMELGVERPQVVLDVSAPDEVPIANAEVRIDGEKVGTTDGQGRIAFDTVPGQATKVEVVPEDPTLEPVVLELAGGSGGEHKHELVVPYAAREVDVAVVDAAGEAVPAASIKAYGDGEVEGQAVEGSGKLELAPGTWTVTTTSETGEVGTARVVVPVDPKEEARIELMVKEVKAAADGDLLKPEAPILFDLDSDVITADALAVIDDLARWLKADRSASLVEVAGHTDDQGGVVYNQQLSERRAFAVRAALANRGVAPERLIARGYGLSRPATSGTDPDSRQLNRRVELQVLRRAD